MIEIQMAKTAQMIMNQVLALKSGENVCLITDTQSPQTITKVLAIAARIAGAEVVIVTMKPTGVGGAEPPRLVAEAMKSADVIISQVSYSLTHTNAQRNALKNGARICNLREMHEDMMIYGGVTADYFQVKQLTDRLASILTGAKVARLTTKEGTDISIGLEGRAGAVLAGFAQVPGSFSGLPDGEATIAPVEGSSYGIIKNPFMIEKINTIRDNLTLKVEKGRITHIEGGREAKQIEEIFTNADANAVNIAEFAIGTNPKCRIIEISREIKKRLGTAHIGIGDNITLGGNVESSIHIDIIFLNPTIEIDKNIIMQSGKLMI